MIRIWLGIALLAGSWLLGLSYYQAAHTTAWLVTVIAGTLLLAGVVEQNLSRRRTALTLALLAFPAWILPWPDRAAPLWIAAGLAIELLPPTMKIRRLGGGAIAAGVVLLAQSLMVSAYTALTVRSHDLPMPLTAVLSLFMRLLGIDASAGEGSIAVHSLRETRTLAATWDLLADPATLCFAAGALALLGLIAGVRVERGHRWSRWGLWAGVLTLIVLAWLPVRAAMMTAVCAHRELLSDFDVPLHVMSHLFSPWVQIPLLAVPVLLAWWLVRLPAAEPSPSTTDTPRLAPRREAMVIALWAIAAAVWAVAIYWEPIGRQKLGVVMVVERHSTWESTTRPYDTNWYGLASGYNYAAMHAACSQYFSMTRLMESDPIDDTRLAPCDILFIKTPTARYEPQEVEAIERFVHRGGGLLLMGEHTNLDRGGTYLNDIARRFGFLFRYDLLFGMESAYEDLYTPPTLAPHPIVQHVPLVDFAVSCSIDPGFSRGRAVIESTGLWSLPPDYHVENFFPRAYHHPDMRAGAFVQLWATRYGHGRVAAFTDSTQFSNYSTFEPGKMDLMLGMLQWLNYRNVLGDMREYLLALGLVPAVVALILARRRRTDWLVLLAAMLCGFSLGTSSVAAFHRWAMPPLQPKRPAIQVTVDRTVSDVPLGRGVFVSLDGEGYSMFERWIPRLGYVTTRQEGPAALDGDVLAVICPRRPVSDQFRRQVEQYVDQGGKLLVLDSPENADSTANRILEPFGLSVGHDQARQGEIAFGQRTVPVERSCEVRGGDAIVRLGDRPVAATVRRGKGTVMVLGFGSLFNDRNMGGSWTIEPDSPTRTRYDFLFAILRHLAERKPLPPK
jgi:hypothetical protein